jgi:hypothetical protein
MLRCKDGRFWPITSEARCRTKVRFRETAEIQCHVALEDSDANDPLQTWGTCCAVMHNTPL